MTEQYIPGDASVLFDSKEGKALLGRVENLFERWQDEKQFEDFEDYKKVLAKNLPKSLSFKSAKKNPFVVSYFIKGRTIEIKCTRKQISWQLLAK